MGALQEPKMAPQGAPLFVPSICSPGFTSDLKDAFCELVDLERYPIHELDSPACRKLIADCQQSWQQHGSVSLPGFIRESLRAQMSHEVSDLPAHRRLYTQTAYTKTGAETNEFGPSHPANRLLQMDIHAVAGDKLPGTLM